MVAQSSGIFDSNTIASNITNSITSNHDLASSLTTLNDSLTTLSNGSCADAGDDISETKTNIVDAQNKITGATSNLLSALTTFNTSHEQLKSGTEMLSTLSGQTIQNINTQNSQLQNEISNKRRMTEINNYYSDKNTYINNILKNLVIIVGLIILFTILSKTGIIPDNISTIITIILVLGIIIYIIYSIYDINIRDKFNFNEFIIPWDSEAKHLEGSDNEKTGYTDIRDKLGKNILGGINNVQNLTNTCLGDNCCMPGTIYDIERSACIKQCDSGKTYTVSVDKTTGEQIGSCT
tara:strand:- start:5411 stop:6292 length:882 start_codon:yes stop_codon:yes gene_type:complete